MCGITARVGRGDAVDELLTGLENLEYRGYDSAGVAVRNGHGLSVHKREGKIDRLKDRIERSPPSGSMGIGHTRWSTHGPPTDENAHPHTDCTEEIAVVHNGIIENHEALKADLRERGHRFESDTDTEVIPHLLEEHVDRGLALDIAFRRMATQLQGSYAIAAMTADGDAVYATRQGSPLVLGIDEDCHYLASDVPAFLEFTDRVVYLEDGDVVSITEDGYEIVDADGRPLDREVRTVDWVAEDAEKGRYDHYMRKEISEQPTALAQTVEGRIDDTDDSGRQIDSGNDSDGNVADGSGDINAGSNGANSEKNNPEGVSLEACPPGTFTDVSAIQFVACGTSYHAALYGQQLLARRGVAAQTFRAGEYAMAPAPVDDDTLVIGVTQSGETADTLESLRRAAERGARTLALTNVVGSTAARECDDAMFIRAGPEIGVAATKTFSSQVATLALLAERIAGDVADAGGEDDQLLAELSTLPDAVQRVLDETRAMEVVDRYRGMDSYFFIGRGVAHPVACEGALKFKEITYEHAEGFAAGQLKHGPLALVTPNTPVFAVFTGRHTEKTLSNVREVQARGAPVIAVVSETNHEVIDTADATLTIPDAHPDIAAVLANVQLQLVAYHVADHLDRPIDKPRNLAKSVTVE
ncbi:glucosamine--fructose-6-phosphate aminotransferase (isomerizing) [Natronoarchaeum philippinense]|uniref:Glutamine--fructose-6-phosphate aminotransferase [isomerizing] n=1 Tax=Natronoarchaeum philippinense TaxID=558529 RepID=A0A285PA35_NATPI|nr:glutamine--fructose-6-phosphate aminotransferase [Natronoarchaeum philippinense]SNZ16996.1 glucosamine--fructose-6-phosphate aminotransferase (isomerizing) [Natronoarchaeum philippinense]